MQKATSHESRPLEFDYWNACRTLRYLLRGGWAEYGKGGKPYELPAPEDVASPYEPALLSPPAAQQITKRSAGIPVIEFKRAGLMAGGFLHGTYIPDSSR